jgi:tape measure domain-containing protein
MAGQQDVGALVVTLEAQTAAFEKGMAQATNELKKFGSTSKIVEDQFGGLQGTFFKFNTALAAVNNGMNLIKGTFGAVADFAKPREQMMSLKGSFEAVLGSGERAADMMLRTKAAAMELGIPLGTVTDAVRRMSIGMKSMGSSNEEIMKVTENFIKLGATGGSVEEAAAGIFQFSQAMGSGALRGDEMMSLLERVPTVANRIADYLGITVGQLKKLGGEGKVTSEILKNALLDSEGKIAEGYAKLPQRMAQSLARIQILFDSFKIDVAEAFQINENITAGLESLLTKLKPGFENITLFAKDVAANILLVRDAVVALAIVFAVPLVVAIEAATIAALKFALTPVGAVITALAAIVLYWRQIREAAYGAAIAFLEYASATKEFFGGDASNMRSMIIDLEAARMAADAVGDAVLKSGDKSKQGSKEMSDAAKKAADAWKSFIDGLNKSQLDVSMIDAKMKELEKRLNSETNPVMIKKLRDELQQLKDQVGQANDPLYDFRQSIQKTGEEAFQLADKIRIIREEVSYGVMSEDAGNRMIKSLTDVRTETEKLGDSITEAISSNASNSVNQFIDTLDAAKFSFSDFATSVLKDIAKVIMQLLIMKPLMDGVKGYMPGGANTLFASGGSFEGGTSLQQGVYDKPTLFAFANGGMFGARQGRMGVMGEAGPEAILPLKRGANGQLGVQAGGGIAPQTTVNVYNSADATVKTAETTNSDGSKQIDIIIEKKVREMFGTGAMDKSMRSSYGLVRSAA